MLTTKSVVRAASLAALMAVVVFAPRPAPAYLTKLAGNGSLVKWKTTSPTASWNDATQTLTWHSNTFNFTRGNWPSEAEFGAAFQNAFQTLQDVPNNNIKFNRGPDRSTPPITDDDNCDMVLCPDETRDYWNQDISGAFAITMWSWDPTTGVFTDADIEMNGDPQAFNWTTTGPPPPNGSNDIELTAVHELMHGIGIGHSVYFYSMIWPVGRFPEDMMHDRCLAPDDRVVVRTLYGTGLFTISGRVTLQGAGTAVDRAVIVATDGNGVPQATQTTNANGDYSINVPPGNNYVVTAHHARNSTYNSDISFAGATGFVSSAATAPFNVAGNVTTKDFTVTAGTPVMRVTGLALSGGGGLDTQVLFLQRNTTGSIQLEIYTDLNGGATLPNGPTYVTSDIQAASSSFGPASAGVTVPGGETAITTVASTSVVTIPYAVSANAPAGPRNVTFSLTSGERVFLPSLIMIVDDGDVTIGASAGNPGGGASGLGTANVPLLGFTMAATAVEDVRIRELRFNLAGSGTNLPAVRLWIDKGTIGIVDGADVRIFTGDAWPTNLNNPPAELLPGNPPGTVIFDNIAVSIPIGQTVTFLLTADMPATGQGSYTASLTASTTAIMAHGMYYGDVITPTGGAVTGGTHSTGPLTLGGMEQIRTNGGAAIPLGGSIPETSVTFEGVPVAGGGATVGMDIEVRLLGTPFTNTPTASLAAVPGQASGTTVSLVVNTGLVNFSSYHWQARPVSSTTGAGPWTSFGGNSEAAIDFSIDNSTFTTATANLQQFEKDGITPVPLPVLPTDVVKGRVILSATNATANPVNNVRLEVEVRPSGTAFLGTPTHFSTFVPNGTISTVSFSGASGTYHWQARTANTFGTASAWVNFNAAAIHFNFKRSGGGGGSGGCSATIAGPSGGLWWALLALGLLVVFGRQRTV